MTISAAAVSTPAAAEHPARAMLLLGALGVVFGDIGTSPIYAFRESLRAAGSVEAQATVLGILSLVFWAVVLVVALKYVVFVMRADNHGEGGTMALIALALPAAGSLRPVLLVIGLGGASLFFGDAMITPAISVPDRDADIPAVCRACGGAGPRRPVCDPKAGQRPRRPIVRAGYGGVVCGARARRAHAGLRSARGFGFTRSAIRARLSRARR
jgi:K+ potassium transporter